MSRSASATDTSAASASGKVSSTVGVRRLARECTTTGSRDSPSSSRSRSRSSCSSIAAKASLSLALRSEPSPSEAMKSTAAVVPAISS